MENVIVVWKNGTYKTVEKSSSWEYENDKDWLVTIPLSPDKGLIDDSYAAGWNDFLSKYLTIGVEQYKKRHGIS